MTYVELNMTVSHVVIGIGYAYPDEHVLEQNVADLDKQIRFVCRVSIEVGRSVRYWTSYDEIVVRRKRQPALAPDADNGYSVGGRPRGEGFRVTGGYLPASFSRCHSMRLKRRLGSSRASPRKSIVSACFSSSATR